MGKKVELQYFKKSGKYYSEGEFITEEETYYGVIKEVRDRKENNNLPGVTGNDFDVYIKSEKFDDYYPIIIR